MVVTGGKMSPGVFITTRKVNLFVREKHECVCACWTIYLVAVCQSEDACQSACCQTHPGDSENHMTHTGAEGFYRSVPDSLGDDTPTGTERNHPSDHVSRAFESPGVWFI